MNERSFNLEQICHQYRVVTLYVFGSQAERVKDWLHGLPDSLKPNSSDIDIGVRFSLEGERSVTQKVSLAMALENLFRCQRVDLIILQEADPFLAAEIIRGERLFAQDEQASDEYELYVLRRAGDLAPLERERMALVLGETL